LICSFSYLLTIVTVCKTGCSQCADGTGNCISCVTGFDQDRSDPTKCDPLDKLTNGTSCAPQAFGNGQLCSRCSPACQTCNGPSSNNCVICASTGSNIQSLFNNHCVSVNSDGICQGTNGMIADNNKQQCESENMYLYQPCRSVNSLISLGCGAVTPNCASCKIPNFQINSTVANNAQCTGCFPGYFLVNGKCVQTCPSGTFLSQNNNTFTTNSTLSCTSMFFSLLFSR
jgi:hypothetical protein